jgi:hypothetical protein
LFGARFENAVEGRSKEQRDRVRAGVLWGSGLLQWYSRKTYKGGFYSN